MNKKEFDPRLLEAVRSQLQQDPTIYRQWALSEATRKFMLAAIELVTPPRSTAEDRLETNEVMSKLAAREVLEKFVEVVFNLDELVGVGQEPPLGEPSYGAKKRGGKKSGETAKPAKA